MSTRLEDKFCFFRLQNRFSAFQEASHRTEKRFSTRRGIQVRYSWIVGDSCTPSTCLDRVWFLERQRPASLSFSSAVSCKPVFPSCTSWQNWAEMGNAGSAIECCGPCTIDKSLVAFIFSYHCSCHFTFDSWRCVLQVLPTGNLNRSALLAMILEHRKPRARHCWVFIPACSFAFALWSSKAIVFWVSVH